MSKPEDVSQEAWDAADVECTWPVGITDAEIIHDLRASIARAIDGAVAAEREACATIAINFVVTSNTRDVDLIMQEAASADTAERIAQTIRQRGHYHE